MHYNVLSEHERDLDFPCANYEAHVDTSLVGYAIKFHIKFEV